MADLPPLPDEPHDPLPTLEQLRDLSLDNRRPGLVRIELQEYALDPLNLSTFLLLAQSDPHLRPVIWRVLIGKYGCVRLRELGLTPEADELADPNAGLSDLSSVERCSHCSLHRDTAGSPAAVGGDDEDGASDAFVHRLMDLTFGTIIDYVRGANAGDASLSNELNCSVSLVDGESHESPAVEPSALATPSEAGLAECSLDSYHHPSPASIQESALSEGGDAGHAVAESSMEGGDAGTP
jgi:hypothetical protein